MKLNEMHNIINGIKIVIQTPIGQNRTKNQNKVQQAGIEKDRLTQHKKPPKKQLVNCYRLCGAIDVNKILNKY